MISSESDNTPNETGLSPEQIAFFNRNNSLGSESVAFALPWLKGRKRETFGDEDDEFVLCLQDLKQKLGLPENATVIYPGSSTHVGVARAFGKDNVTHVDPDNHAVEALSDSGYKATQLGIEDYAPNTPADVMVALNSYGDPTTEIVRRLVKPGGFVIANNYTGWANDLNHLNKDLQLVAGVLPSYSSSNAEIVDQIDLPIDATDFIKEYWIMKPGGAMTQGTPEHHTFVDESGRFPDALFVFERLDN